MALPSIHSQIQDVVAALDASPLQTWLGAAFERHEAGFVVIEAAFEDLLGGPISPERCAPFFGSWRATNNSAMCVSGLGNRLSLLLHQRAAVADPDAVIRALIHLHRVSDEDLGVGGSTKHAVLFARMANALCSDDRWSRSCYSSEAAQAFAAWKDRSCLANPNLAWGVLVTVIHEAYTHGEVEFMLPRFLAWLQRGGWSKAASRQALAWIFVHCGPTEREHFRYAVNSLDELQRGLGVTIDAAQVDDAVATYIELKQAVMTSTRFAPDDHN